MSEKLQNPQEVSANYMQEIWPAHCFKCHSDYTEKERGHCATCKGTDGRPCDRFGKGCQFSLLQAIGTTEENSDIVLYCGGKSHSIEESKNCVECIKVVKEFEEAKANGELGKILASPKEEKCEHDYQSLPNTKFGVYCSKCHIVTSRDYIEPAPLPAPLTSEGWESRFERLYNALHMFQGHRSKIQIHEIKYFICTELAKCRYEERERILKEIEKTQDLETMYDHIDKDGKRRRCVYYDDLIDILSDEEGK